MQDVRTLIEKAREGLDTRIATRLSVSEDNSLDAALPASASATQTFLYEIALADDDPLDGHFGFLLDDTDYKRGYLVVVHNLTDAERRPVPARVVELYWRSFYGADGAREAAELIYAAIEQVAAATV